MSNVTATFINIDFRLGDKVKIHPTYARRGEANVVYTVTAEPGGRRVNYTIEPIGVGRTYKCSGDLLVAATDAEVAAAEASAPEVGEVPHVGDLAYLTIPKAGKGLYVVTNQTAKGYVLVEVGGKGKGYRSVSHKNIQVVSVDRVSVSA